MGDISILTNYLLQSFNIFFLIIVYYRKANITLLAVSSGNNFYSLIVFIFFHFIYMGMYVLDSESIFVIYL